SDVVAIFGGVAPVYTGVSIRFRSCRQRSPLATLPPCPSPSWSFCSSRPPGGRGPARPLLDCPLPPGDTDPGDMDPGEIDKEGRMYQRLLAEIRAAQARYGEQLQPPCTDERLARLRRQAREELDVELPDEYAAFLRTQDGLNHNGLYIYASET